MRVYPIVGLLAATLLALMLAPSRATAQVFGSELQNSMTPAAGAMAGVSIALPQDVAAALNGNPGTLTQFEGTQFIFSAGWAEPTYNASYDGGVPALNLAGLSAFQAKSTAQGSAVPNVGIIHGTQMLDRPVVFGLGLLPVSGMAIDFRNTPGSNGVSAEYLNLGTAAVAAVQLTDRLSVGGSMQVGFAIFQGGFVGSSGAAQDFALRGTGGATYDLGMNTTVGAYYQSQEPFTFDNSLFLLGTFHNIKFSQPRNVGLGIANRSLLDGRLLLATDIVYKNWSDADFWNAVWKDQWVYQFGAQYTAGRAKLRIGYAYNTNPIRNNVGDNVNGIIQTALANGVQYLQATTGGSISQNRLTGGFGVADVIPGVDADLFAGGMFRNSQTYGHSSSSIESYWVGLGLTWHFDAPQPRG